MKPLRKFLDSIEPLFSRGGRFEKFEAIYEMVDTLFFTPADVTRGSPHVRDAIDLKRVMIMVVFAATPCALIGMWNVGFQANSAMASLGIEWIDGWRGSMLALLGAGYDPGSVYDNFIHGLLYFLPIYIVTMAAGGFWEVLFASVRNHEVNEGFFVTSFLYALILPATTPLWQVALGISFGVVIGKEVFGGTGKNFLNPALVGRAFLYFAYPVQLSGDAVWVPIDGYTGATALAVAANEGMSGLLASGLTYSQAFIGQMEGSLGETSLAACLFGAAMLIYTRIASWRIIVSVFAGMIIPALLFSSGDSSNPMMTMPWEWHIAVGGFAFGAVFMATDPVSAPDTMLSHIIFGLLIGVLTWVIRVINPAFPEGIMLAILLGNIFAPLIDYFVIRANVRRRVKRNA
ncbi:MAG: NADH:ubiquinone reductase (Na(+)-transporting) subunit B [Gammaproteobacteria bacterium]|jgi:Na+-transporting NADH:ubiquinone oxidoreductase subunit B|nr:NADH:ubiquinone reductase (Na(+)-transporting) subunit B [Gammaproteobacteria bacterium]MDH3847576.1 NADH:ubiquinone reductase (Na(+)-transporting) subunit B [Gammaproteobacteria bacterium]MDH3862675.1 NADH:ubiquinone reductase (Na(+)-transporting) subunit B [Gammaproteobacteria bacterium]MDH3905172.1 NADH:ubiquinone reductase (Na(+)-transporting) subunit B [Gammaproteobacteria bacterium]MDH3907392.1 NADH:ubiquinone reductase (Na(+)-transporting) subunit B [Gammaproteobacteria bacterium]